MSYVHLYWCFAVIFVDPSETAKDMTDRYKTECANLKIRPIGKLLEQLEVCLHLLLLLFLLGLWDIVRGEVIVMYRVHCPYLLWCTLNAYGDWLEDIIFLLRTYSRQI